MAQTGEEVNTADGTVVVLGRREQETEDGRDQAREIECPSSSNDVHKKTPGESTDGETSVGAGPDVTLLVIWDVHLLVDSRCDQTNTLGPGKVEEVTETTEEPECR